MLALATLIPVGLALGLLLFGSYGTHRPPALTPGRVMPAVVAAVVLGPVAASVLGLLGWLVLLFVCVAAIGLLAVLRPPPLPH